MLYALAGFAAGLVHVLSGPDHLAAIAPLAARNSRVSWLTGSMWGIGHTAGVWIVGAASIALREVFPVQRLSNWGEHLVGLMLIGIGLWGLQRAASARLHVHEHEHEHDGVRHAHAHFHRSKSRGHKHRHVAVAVGALHGLAGSSHLLGILPALALPGRVASWTYIAAFGIGSILAMTVFAFTIGLLVARFAGRAQRTYRYVLAGCGSVSILIGCFWLASPR